METNLELKSLSIIGESKPIRDVFDVVARAAGSQSTVMIYGESGTGKELIARALHMNSPRASKPFMLLTAVRFLKNFLKASYLVTKRVRSPERSTRVLAEWN